MNKTMHNQGYIRLTKGKKIDILEHRKMMEEHIGRELNSDEVVHHKDGDKKNNRLENLELMSVSEHSRLHRKKGITTIEMRCMFCGKRYVKRESTHKYQLKKGATQFACGKVCSGKLRINTFDRRGIGYKKKNEIIRRELKKGLTGYAIAKKHGLNKKTVYTHINKINSGII